MSRRPVPQAVASARGEEVLYERFAYQWYPFSPRPLQRCTCDYCTGKPPVPRFGFSNEYSEALSAEAPGGFLRAVLRATCASCDGEGFIGPRGTPCPDCSWART